MTDQQSADQPLIFVVGTGRCGSTALSNVLRLHPHILSLSEFVASMEPDPFPDGLLTGEQFLRFLEEPRAFTTSVMRHGFWPTVVETGQQPPGTGPDNEMPVLGALSVTVLPHLTDDPQDLLSQLRKELPNLPTAPVADHYRALFRILGQRFGTRVVAERSGYSLRTVPRLRQLFPEARFVHLYRNGPDTALSMSQYPVFQVLRVLLERAIAKGRGQEGVSEEMADMFRDGEVDVRPILNADVPTSAFGKMWSDSVLDGLHHLAGLPPERLASFAFEDLLDRPESELTRLAGFLGVAPMPEWLDAGKAELDPTRRHASLALPPEELAALQESCAPGMRALGMPTGADAR